MLSFDLTAPMKDWLPTALYPGFRPGMPDIVLARLPQELADLAGAPFKSWILENEKEAALLEARLSEPLPVRPDGSLDFIAGPDSAVRKKGKGAHRTDPVVGIYSPVENGWPLIVLVSLPVQNPELERGCYAWEAFETDAEAVAHAKMVIEATGVSPTLLRGEDFPWN